MRTVVSVPSGDHLSLRAARSSLLCVSLEVPSAPTRRYHSSSPRVPPATQRCLHTRRFGTLASPSPSVDDLPWGPHLPGHRRTSSFNYHFDHGFVVFKDVQLRFIVRRMCVGEHMIHITQLINLLSSLGFGKNSISFLYARMFGLDIVVG